jgi:hypothetical protein
MKRILMITAMLTVLAAPFTVCQDGPHHMPRDESRYKELQALRFITIIQALDIEATSPKGAALMDALNKHSDVNRNAFVRRGELLLNLQAEFKLSTPDENRVKKILEELDALQIEVLESHNTFQAELRSILTPMERAKLVIAEETYRQRLRRAMQGFGKGGGAGRRQYNNPRE